jgi:hypothetical protein
MVVSRFLGMWPSFRGILKGIQRYFTSDIEENGVTEGVEQVKFRTYSRYLKPENKNLVNE